VPQLEITMKTLIALLIMTLTFTAGNSFAQDEALTADNCLESQNLNAEDVDVTHCPALPELPQDAAFGVTEELVSLGAWELGQTSDGNTYKYGTLSEAGSTPRRLQYYGEEESIEVNEKNLTCWAKGYYRLRQILQNPPLEYVKLREAGFQVRFFQFQTDLRNGPTGFKQISSYRDHLVKWVTVITEDGVCIQPTLEQFKAYASSELERRGLN
jgi:hypothetical protein